MLKANQLLKSMGLRDAYGKGKYGKPGWPDYLWFTFYGIGTFGYSASGFYIKPAFDLMCKFKLKPYYSGRDRYGKKKIGWEKYIGKQDSDEMLDGFFGKLFGCTVLQAFNRVLVEKKLVVFKRRKYYTIPSSSLSCAYHHKMRKSWDSITDIPKHLLSYLMPLYEQLKALYDKGEMVDDGWIPDYSELDFGVPRNPTLTTCNICQYEVPTAEWPTGKIWGALLDGYGITHCPGCKTKTGCHPIDTALLATNGDIRCQPITKYHDDLLLTLECPKERR